MKKFKTSEDLDEILISLPLNVARTIHVMCSNIAEKANLAMERIDSGEVPAGEHQKRSIQSYATSQEILHQAITEALVDNVSIEDQETIRQFEGDRLEALEAEIMKMLKADLLADPDGIKQEFDMTDLPEGTILSPGSDEEN